MKIQETFQTVIPGQMVTSDRDLWLFVDNAGSIEYNKKSQINSGSIMLVLGFRTIHIKDFHSIEVVDVVADIGHIGFISTSCFFDCKMISDVKFKSVRNES